MKLIQFNKIISPSVVELLNRVNIRTHSELNRKLIDDLIIGGQCIIKTTESGIERIDPVSDEWDSVKSKMV